MKWNLIVVLSCISLMDNNAEHPFICLLATSYVFFEKVTIQILCPFFNWLIFVVVIELYKVFIYFVS